MIGYLLLALAALGMSIPGVVFVYCTRSEEVDQ